MYKMTPNVTLDQTGYTSLLLLVDGYHDFMDKGDIRVKDWPFMSGPLPTLGMCFLYFLLTTKIGPWFMKGRTPYDLRGVIILYNGFQVILSAWLFYEFGQGGWFHNYSVRCQPVDYEPSGLRMVHVSYWYYMSKYTEFFDTFFFILRGKMSHVSNLHLFHHGLMPFSIWFGAKFLPGGHSTMMGLLNTFVHTVMYFYYMVAAMGPRYAKFIWWKKYVTTLQMVQFVIIFVHSFQLIFTECDYPKALAWFIGLHGVLFLFLFAKFYTKTYKKQSTTTTTTTGKEKSVTTTHSSPKIMNGTAGMSNGGHQKTPEGTKLRNVQSLKFRG